jgi:hypothetical protein
VAFANVSAQPCVSRVSPAAACGWARCRISACDRLRTGVSAHEQARKHACTQALTQHAHASLTHARKHAHACTQALTQHASTHTARKHSHSTQALTHTHASTHTLERGAAACQPAPTPKHAQCAEPALAPLSCYKSKLTEQHTSTHTAHSHAHTPAPAHPPTPPHPARVDAQCSQRHSSPGRRGGASVQVCRCAGVLVCCSVSFDL